MNANDKDSQAEIDFEKVISFWITSSDNDFTTMNNLFKSRDYHWSLFIGHLTIEKLLKAYYVKTLQNYPPRTHDLRRLAEETSLVLTDEQKLFFDTLSRFNIRARYDDYKLEFYKMATKSYTKEWLKKIKEHRKWIKETLLKL